MSDGLWSFYIFQWATRRSMALLARDRYRLATTADNVRIHIVVGRKPVESA